MEFCIEFLGGVSWCDTEITKSGKMINQVMEDMSRVSNNTVIHYQSGATGFLRM